MPARKIRQEEPEDDTTESTVARLTEEVLVSGGDDTPEQIEPLEEGEEEEGSQEPGRDEKRRKSWKEHTEAAKAAEERATKAEREAAELRGRVGALEQQTRQPAFQPQQQGNPWQAYDDAEKRILEEIRNHRQTFSKMDPKLLTAEDSERFHDKWSELDGTLNRVRMQKEIRAAQASQSQNTPAPEAQAAVSHIRLNYPDLADNDDYMAHANSLVVQKRIAKNRANGTPGAPADMKILDEALQETRRAFGLGPARKVTQARQAAYSGVSSGPTQTAKKNTLNMSGLDGKVYHKMAKARFPKDYQKDPKRALGMLAKDLADEDS